MRSILFLLNSFLISVFCFSQAGTLDETFGDKGKVYTDVFGQCFASAWQADGKILAGGSGMFKCIVIRDMSNGGIDDFFGEEGVATVPNMTSLNKISHFGNF